MLVLVTGSSGRLGSVVVRDLLDNGHDVIPVDIVPSAGPDLPLTQQVDLTTPGALDRLLSGVNAVCHLGNFPGFSRSGPAAGFSNNVTSTYNVAHAVAAAGIKKIVYASSIQAYGAFGENRTPPAYLPIDEEHPLQPSGAYPLSKAVGESIMETFVRRDPVLQAFSLRFTGVLTFRRARQPEAAQSAAPAHFRWGGESLSTYIHVADAARAVRLCCEADRPGHTPLNIVSNHVIRPWSAEMLNYVYGCVSPFRRPVAADEPLITADRARDVLGFVAERSVEELPLLVPA